MTLLKSFLADENAATDSRCPNRRAARNVILHSAVRDGKDPSARQYFIGCRDSAALTVCGLIVGDYAVGHRHVTGVVCFPIKTTAKAVRAGARVVESKPDDKVRKGGIESLIKSGIDRENLVDAICCPRHDRPSGARPPATRSD